MNNLPAYLLNDTTSNITEALAKLGTAAPPHISLENDRFTLVDANGDTEPVTTMDGKTGFPYLDCVIVDANEHASKVYYEKKFVQGSSSPPDCWSDNGVAPSINAGRPQAKSCQPDPSGTYGCKLAVWGAKISEMSGKGVPACGRYQKLAILIPGDDVLFQMRVPPNSLDNLRAYNGKFKGQPVSVAAVVTRITFETGKKLNFAALNYIDEATFKQRQAALAAKQTDVLVGRGDVPIASGALPASGGQETQALPPVSAPSATTPVNAPSAVAQLTSPAAPPTQNASPSAPLVSPSEAPSRRRRRTAAEMAAANAPAAPGNGQAPFRPSDPPAQAPAAPAVPAGQFGIAPGVAPNPELQSALNSIFGN